MTLQLVWNTRIIRMNQENFQRLMLQLKLEITALKTAKKASPLIKMYSKTVQTPSTTPTRFTITYEDGNQPIISEVQQVGGWVILSTPSGNTQYILAREFSAAGRDITVVSTRPIASIVVS